MNSMRSHLQPETQMRLLMGQLFQSLVESGIGQLGTVHVDTHDVKLRGHLAEIGHVLHAGVQHVERQLRAHAESVRFRHHEIGRQRAPFLSCTRTIVSNETMRLVFTLKIGWYSTETVLFSIALRSTSDALK